MATLLIDGLWDRRLLETPQELPLECGFSYQVPFREKSLNCQGWKRLLRLWNLIISMAPPLSHVSKCHTYTYSEHSQEWWLPHFHGQPVLVLDNPFHEIIIFPNIQFETDATWGGSQFPPLPLKVITVSQSNTQDGFGGRQTFSISSIKFAFSFWITWNFAFSCYCDGCVQMLD